MADTLEDRMGKTQPMDEPRDYIVVVPPDGSKRSVPIDVRTITIGREAGNDVDLDDPFVSKEHAEVRFDGGKYWVIDLDSRNGTYLGKLKLSPHHPEEWTTDKLVRVGEHRLLLRSSQLGDSTLVDISELEDPIAAPVSKDRRVGVLIATDLSADPDVGTEVSARLSNFGNEPDDLKLTVHGLPDDWVTLDPPHDIRVPPAGSEDATLIIRPPRESSSRAGPHPMRIRVTSLNDPERIAEAPATLTISAYHGLKSRLEQEIIRENTKLLAILQNKKPIARVKVKNQGNAPQTYNITWEADARDLDFEPRTMELTVREGDEVSAESRVRPRRLRLLGTDRPHGFCALVRSPDDREEESRGTLVSTALVPLDLQRASFVVAVLALVAAIIFGPPTSRPDLPDLKPRIESVTHEIMSVIDRIRELLKPPDDFHPSLTPTPTVTTSPAGVSVVEQTPSPTPTPTVTASPEAGGSPGPERTPIRTAAVETPTAAVTPSMRHIVQAGETVSAIAAHHGTTVAAIVEINGIEDANKIYVGQVLLIPLPATPTP